MSPPAIERILIVGAGSIGRRHLKFARLLNPDADIQVLRHAECDGIPEFANGCLVRVDAAVAYAPQIAVIANPAPCHVTIARPLAEAGSHLLIEKPLSDSSRAVADFLEVCRKNGSVVMTGYNLRFMPSLQRLRSMLTDGGIGEILSVRAEAGQYLPSWRPNIDYRSSVSARRELGGGVLLELSHEIDYLRWLFGEIGWVQATLRRQSALDVDVEDTAHLICGFPSTHGRREVVASLNIDFIRHDTVRQCTVIGENGSLRWNALTGTLELYKAGTACWETVFSHPCGRDDSYIAEWENFLDCVRGYGTTPLVTGEDGLAVLRVIEAARKSSDSNRTVMLETKTA